MSHVDEGALHAYLDGALDEYPAAEARCVREHVETCATCAERLAEARALREEASRVLALATPLVEAPTLEELRAHMRAGQPPRPAISVRLHRLGWAASVMLALGTGWVLRGGNVSTSPLAFERSPAPPASRPAPVGSSEPAADSVPTTPSTTGATQPGAIQEPSGPPPATATEPSSRVAAAPVAEPDAVREAPRLDDISADLEAAAGVDRVVADLLAAAEAEVRAIEPQIDAPDAALAPLGLSAEPRAGPADASGGGAAAPSAEDARPGTDSRADVEPGRVLTSARSGGGAAPGVTLDLGGSRADDVSEENGEEEPLSLVVPGLEVIGVQPVGEGTTFAGMRALQRLAGGDTLEIFHLPQSVHPSTLPPRAPGRNELVRQRGEGWLVLRARLAEPELEALLQRLESGS